MTVLAWIVGSILAALLVLAGGLAIFAAWTARRVEKVLPPRGHFIEVDGARIHYLDEGSGPPLVLIHGLGGQMHNFTHSLLDRLKHNHRVIILDRPGCAAIPPAPATHRPRLARRPGPSPGSSRGLGSSGR